MGFNSAFKGLKSEHKVRYYVMVKHTDTVYGDGRKTRATHMTMFL